MKREPAWRIAIALSLQATAVLLALAILARCTGVIR
jgi:hypothetical protein